MKKAILLFWTLATAMMAGAQMRFAVMSDMHVLEQSLHDDGAAFRRCAEGDPKVVEHSQELFEKAVGRIEAEMPDVLLIPGDLTYNGEKASHEYVARKLGMLADKGVKVYVIPGNHDVGNPVARSYIGNESAKVATVSSGEFEAMYGKCGYGDAVMKNGLSYMAYPSRSLAVICLDSRKPDTETKHYSEGGLTESTLAWAESAAAKAKAEGRRVIGMMHHPVMAHFDGHEELAATYIANQASGYPALSEVQKRLAAAGVNVMFTGHFHLQSIQHETTEGGELWDVMTGSLCSYPSPLRMGEMGSDGTLKLAAEVFSDYHAIEMKRNENTTNGMLSTLCAKMESKLAGQKKLMGKLGIPSTSAEIFPVMQKCMLQHFTGFVNALSQGDEEQGDAKAIVKGCNKAYKKFMRSMFGVSYPLVRMVKRKDVSKYKKMMKTTCGSAMYNYKGEKENVVSDNEIVITL